MDIDRYIQRNDPTWRRLAELSRRYRRGDHASASGAGLGLAIVACIMAAHGGRIETREPRSELSLTFPSSPKDRA